MPDETKEAAHPLDRQNAIERAIQLEGPENPDEFKMPDGRTLTEVRQSNAEIHAKEFLEENKMIGRRTRELSIPEFSKGKDLVMTPAGNIVDVTPPPIPEETTTLSKSRTSAAEVEEGVIPPPSDTAPPKSMEPMGTFTSQPGATTPTTAPAGAPSATPPTSPTPAIPSTTSPTTGPTSSGSTPSGGSGKGGNT